jgi:hypothetical protein
MQGQDTCRQGLENATALRYQRAIADKGVSDAQLMKSIGMTEHPQTTIRRGLEESASNRQSRPDRRGVWL